MTHSNDISKLFKQIGVSGADYQEIHKQNGARESQSRWPLLDSLHAQANRAPTVDTRRRFDVESEAAPAQPVVAPSEDALFSHIATEEVVQAHEQATTSLTQEGDVDRHATNAAMAAVDAAAPPVSQTEKQAPQKIAEFIAPRGNLLSAMRPSAHRAPVDPSSTHGPATMASAAAAVPTAPFTAASAAAAPVSAAPVSASLVLAAPAAAASVPAAPAAAAFVPAAAPLAAAPVPAAPVSNAPVNAAPAAAPVATSPGASSPALAQRLFATVPSESRANASPAMPATPAAQPAPAATAAAAVASAPIGGLFARLAHPEGPPADAATEPVAAAAPVSLFDRLIRS